MLAVLDENAFGGMLSRTAGLAVGTSGNELGAGKRWTKMDHRDGACSPCCYSNGVVLIDAGAGRVLVGQSHVQPTPPKFRTKDFVAIFGSVVPNCVMLSDRIHCQVIKLWHDSVAYTVERWSGVDSKKLSRTPGSVVAVVFDTRCPRHPTAAFQPTRLSSPRQVEGKLWGSGVVVRDFSDGDDRRQFESHWDAMPEILTQEKVYSGTHAIKIPQSDRHGLKVHYISECAIRHGVHNPSTLLEL
jgi:hypothetical protein